jgi:hypothetical protein
MASRRRLSQQHSCSLDGMLTANSIMLKVLNRIYTPF